MLMEFKLHDYVAAGISIGAAVVFVFLLCWHSYTDWKEHERRRQRRARMEVKHG